MNKSPKTAREAFIDAQYKQTDKDFQVLHTINLDWFEAMLSGAFIDGDDPQEKYEFDGSNIILAKKGSGTKVFKYSYEIYVHGKKFGKCHCHPRSPEVMKPDFIQFQVENNVLYENTGFKDIKYLFTKLHWKVKNITRFDIALDGVRVLHLVDSYLKNEIDKLGKAKMNCFFAGKRKLTGFDIGSKASNKWVTGYNKSKELEKKGKAYIQQFWARTGLDVFEENIERLELKIRNEEVKKIVDFNWEDLDNFEYLASIFRTTLKNFFEFVEKSNDTNVSRKKRIEFINWDFLGANLLPRLSTQETTEVYRMKQASKTAYWCYLASGMQYYANIAQEMAMNVNCLDWYLERLERWKLEYHKRCGQNADGVISFQYMMAFEIYDDNQQLKLFEINKPETFN